METEATAAEPPPDTISSSPSSSFPAHQEKRKQQQPQSSHNDNDDDGAAAEDDAAAPTTIEYELRDGMRHVKPYVYSFHARAKGRWWDKAIAEVFQKEFRTYNPRYYVSSIEEGTITVNGAKVAPTYLLQNNDLVIHKCHRHEPPVTGDKIVVVADTPDLFVVSKPATIPIHPCGAYRYNSLLSIIEHDHPGTGKLHLIYRLDRLTSGLVILAKSSAKANEISQELQRGQTKKCYLALVKGQFVPEAFQNKDRQVVRGGGGEGKQDGKEEEQEEEVLFHEWCKDSKLAMIEGDEQGARDGNGTTAGASSSSAAAEEDSREARKKRKKEAKEERKRASQLRKEEHEQKQQERNNEDGGTPAGIPQEAPMQWRLQSDGSICVQTGIRCVSYRDAIYECSAQGKPSMTLFRLRGYDGTHSLLECRPVTGRTHQIRNHLQWLGFPIANDPNYGDAATVSAFKGAWQGQQGKNKNTDDGFAALPSVANGVEEAAKHEGETEEEKVQRLCPYCYHGDEVMFKGEQLHHRGIYLHAWRYEGRTWSYETPLPAWAAAEPYGFLEGEGEGKERENN